MWEFVDRIVYINLDKRNDRNERMINHILPKFGYRQITRFSAIENKNGAVGCYLSHIAVLTDALNDNVKNILVLEDDIAWNKFDENYEKLQEWMNYPYDVIMLGGTAVQTQGNRVISSNCSHAYLVNKDYIKVLLDTLKDGLTTLLRHPDLDTKFALDQFWKHRQRMDTWLILQPCMLYQIADYSDIDGSYKPIDNAQSF